MQTMSARVRQPAESTPQEPARTGRNRLLNARDAVEYLGISLSTLNRIEKQGLLVPFRTPGGHRRYGMQMLDEYLEGTRQRPNGPKDNER
jgi:DNA-binding transcriptional MerR regulator